MLLPDCRVAWHLDGNDTGGRFCRDTLAWQFYANSFLWCSCHSRSPLVHVQSVVITLMGQDRASLLLADFRVRSQCNADVFQQLVAVLCCENASVCRVSLNSVSHHSHGSSTTRLTAHSGCSQRSLADISSRTHLTAHCESCRRRERTVRMVLAGLGSAVQGTRQFQRLHHVHKRFRGHWSYRCVGVQ